MSSVSVCEKCESYELKGQIRALHDLINVAQASVASLELPSLLCTILRGAMNFTEMPMGRIALYDKRSGKMTLHAQAGFSSEAVVRNALTVESDSLMDNLLRRNEVYYVEDTEQADVPESQFEVNEAVRSLILIPLVTKSSIHGIIRLDDHIPRTFDKNRISQVSALATFAAISIENAKFHEETQRMAIADSLTGLNNRRYFDKVLPQEYERAHRDGIPFSLMMIDVDNFKKFNDTHGHHFGDRVLVAIGRVLRKTLRRIDFAFRYGGEEFVVILPETDLGSAHKVAERIRQRVVSESKKLLRNQNDPPVTVSIGISCYPRDAACSETLLAMADQLLYKAKRAGRNRVVGAEASVP